MYTVISFVVAILPQFTACAFFGKTIALQNGSTVEMKCLWSARSELILAAGIFTVGALIFTSRRLETRRSLSIMGIILGAFTMLIPSELIGVCATPSMLCHSVMLPSMLATGGLVAAISAFGLVYSYKWGRFDERIEVSPEKH
jgi:hypothetical protein